MVGKSFVFTLIIVSILAVGVYSATAQEPQTELAGNGGCEAGSEYDPNCDVNRDGDMTVEDLSLVANHWGQAGVWTAGGDFWSLLGNTGTISTTHFIGTTDGEPLVFRTNNNEAMRIDSAGNVGLGTTGPGGKLEVEGAGIRVDVDDGNHPSAINNALELVSQTAGSPNIILHTSGNHPQGELGGSISWSMQAMTDQYFPTAKIQGVFQQEGEDAAHLVFSTAIGGGTAPVERMRITHEGNVGIGTTELFGLPDNRLVLESTGINDGLVIFRSGNVASGEAAGALSFALQENVGSPTVVARVQVVADGEGENRGQLSFVTRNDQGLLREQVRIDENGNVGIGTDLPLAKLHVEGRTKTDVLEITGGSDLAEPFEIAGAGKVEPGMVVAIDPAHPGQLRIADQAYDRTVAGCVSGAGGVNPGLVMQQEGSVAAGSVPVALSGRVYCWADAAYGAIHAGDLLTTSDTPGHLMKAADPDKANGAMLGKAMSELEEGRGLILVLVSLQ